MDTNEASPRVLCLAPSPKIPNPEVQAPTKFQAPKPQHGEKFVIARPRSPAREPRALPNPQRL